MSEPRKKKFGCLALILIGVGVLLPIPLLWLAFNFRPMASEGKPFADVSPETTWITEPLDQNGDVDYLEALNLRQSKGITPENNAAVLYTRAFGPCSFDEQLFTQYLTKLGIDGSQVYDNPFVEFDDWLEKRNRELQIEIPSDANSPDNASEQYDYLTDGDAKPWSSEQFPVVAEWMEENSAVAKTIRDATKRQRCYFPMVANAKPKILSALLPYPQKIRNAARYFSLTALQHLHDNDIEKFIDDLKCMEQMAQHIAQGPTLVEELVSTAIKNMVLSRIIAACDLELDADDLKALMAFTNTIKPLDDLASRIDIGERFMMLDAAVSAARGESEMAGSFPLSFIDWNETLRTLNAERDLLVEKISAEDYNRRMKGSREMWERLEQMNQDKSIDSVTSLVMGRKSNGRRVGKLLTTFLAPSFDQLMAVESRLKSKIKMAQIAVAISIYRKEKGELPDTTQQLVPEYLESIPVEDATGKPYEMSKTDTDAGFRVHSAAWIEGVGEPGLEIMIAPATNSFETFLQEN